VYGDTNSTLAGAVTASKMNIPVIHVEAGLRSFDRSMPEEVNRVITDHVSTLLFAPTLSAVEHLKREGIGHTGDEHVSANLPAIYHSGDVMFDNALHFSKKISDGNSIIKKYELTKGRFNLITIHRESNTNNTNHLNNILSAILELIGKGERFIFPVHPRTKNKLDELKNALPINDAISHGSLILSEPVSYFGMLELESSAKQIFTDSGGVQKEAFFNKKPCVVLRERTEWTELVESKNAILAGTDRNRIVNAFNEFESSKGLMFADFYGNGKAAEFICEKIIEHLS
jgi:UDP-GlcNAc3NAcA epimerase